MTLIPGRDYFMCEFCQAIAFMKENPDGVVPVGQRTELECPVCGIELCTASIVGHEILQCRRCEGVLVYQEDFPLIIRGRVHRGDGAPRLPLPLGEEDRRRMLKCPMCDGPFALHPYYGPGNVLIDTCSECTLIWLDRGEIATIVAAAQGRHV